MVIKVNIFDGSNAICLVFNLIERDLNGLPNTLYSYNNGCLKIYIHVRGLNTYFFCCLITIYLNI